jgi:hypothetical protein
VRNQLSHSIRTNAPVVMLLSLWSGGVISIAVVERIERRC